MLKSLQLNSFALIDRLHLQLEPGLHLLSGDTGAGKSLLFDALHLLAGQKSDGIWVREGATKADLRCEFVLDPMIDGDQELLRHLQEHELQDEDQPEIMHLRRVIYRDGRSKAQINGVPVKASILKSLTAGCFLFHDQHESMELLKPENQLRWLDYIGGHTESVQAYDDHFKVWQGLQQEQARLQAAHRVAAQRRDYLTFQLEEMQGLNLEPAHVQELEARVKLQDHAARWQRQANDIIELTGGDNDTLRAVRTWLHQLQQDREPHPKCVAAGALLETALIHFDEAQQELLSLENDIDFDEQAIAQAQHLISKVFNLSRKHQVPTTELLELQSVIEQELSQLQVDEARLESIEQEVIEARHQLMVVGQNLRKAREAASDRLVDLLTRALVDLGMPTTFWDIQFKPLPDPRSHGLDDIQFLMSSNQGHRPQPLGKIASGGELSRISLVLHAFGRGDTMKSQLYCFDEVDVGVSGQVAVAIGDLLHKLSNKSQVLCISHAPQVTAQPGTHWQAQKSLGEAGQVATQWTQLDEPSRIKEIARMLGTAAKPELALARKLIKGGQEKQKQGPVEVL